MSGISGVRVQGLRFGVIECYDSANGGESIVHQMDNKMEACDM